MELPHLPTKNIATSNPTTQLDPCIYSAVPRTKERLPTAATLRRVHPLSKYDIVLLKAPAKHRLL